MFESNAGAYPNEARFRCCNQGYTQTSDWAEKASLFGPLVSYEENKVLWIRPLPLQLCSDAHNLKKEISFLLLKYRELEQGILTEREGSVQLTSLY
jgi:hypothetical protein